MTERRRESDGKSSRLDAWKAKLVIDKEDLDGCLVEHPDLSYHIGDAYLDAVDRRDMLKLELEEVQAELDVEVRAEFERAETKTTEAQVKNAVIVHERHRTKRRQLLQAEDEVRRLANLKDGFVSRAYAMRELVVLNTGERRDRAGAAGGYEARARQAREGEEARANFLRDRRARLTGART